MNVMILCLFSKKNNCDYDDVLWERKEKKQKMLCDGWMDDNVVDSST